MTILVVDRSSQSFAHSVLSLPPGQEDGRANAVKLNRRGATESSKTPRSRRWGIIYAVNTLCVFILWPRESDPVTNCEMEQTQPARRRQDDNLSNYSAAI